MGHANTVAVAARWLARSRCRLVLSEHTLSSVIAKVAGTPLSRLVPWTSRWFYPRADAVVAVSSDVKGDLVQVSHLRPDLITVIPNPVVTPELLAGLQAAVGHHFFRPGSPPVVLGIGRLSGEKGFDVLIRAHRILLRDTAARLMIVGEGEDRPLLEKLVRELGLEDSVAMPGFVDDVPAYIAASAVVVMPSRIEGFGNALVEAMAAGVPVVATACPGGPKDILKDGRYGPLVPVDAPQALAAAVAGILRDPPPAAALQERAGDFALGSVTARYLEIMGCRRTDVDQ
jgi:glycosyltransferase involved in cell wall biosynthesis